MFKLIALNAEGTQIIRATVNCTETNFAERLETSKSRSKSVVKWNVLDQDGNDVTDKFFAAPAKNTPAGRGEVTAIIFEAMKSGKWFTRTELFAKIKALDPMKADTVIWNTIGALMNTLMRKYGFEKATHVSTKDGKRIREFMFAS